MDSVFTEELESVVAEVLAGAASPGTRLQRLCNLLRERVPHYDWFGFYIVVPDRRELALGPFAGEPTEHVRISFGRGICGQTAEREETMVVQDVGSAENYLSCSIHVKSEIVVPVFHDGRVVGEIDIDSHVTGPFTETDTRFLESLARQTAPLVADLVPPEDDGDKEE
ncbi:MAG: GAF domain-containing protein [Spirochaetaceae bacterium]